MTGLGSSNDATDTTHNGTSGTGTFLDPSTDSLEVGLLLHGFLLAVESETSRDGTEVSSSTESKSFVLLSGTSHETSEERWKEHTEEELLVFLGHILLSSSIDNTRNSVEDTRGGIDEAGKGTEESTKLLVLFSEVTVPEKRTA